MAIKKIPYQNFTCFVICFYFPYLLFIVILPPPCLTEYQGCAWETHKHSLMLWSDAIMCSDTAIKNEKISASSTTYQYTTGKNHMSNGRKGSMLCLLSGNWDKVGTSADYVLPDGNWVWTSLFHHVAGVTLIQHRCGIKTTDIGKNKVKVKPPLTKYHPTDLLFLIVSTFSLPLAN